MFPSDRPAPRTLIDDGEIQDLVSALLGPAQPPGRTSVVMKIGGVAVSSPTPLGDTEIESMRAAVAELQQSLRMHGVTRGLSGVHVAPPDARTLRRALAVLVDARARRSALEAALEIFGRKLVEPLGAAFELADVLPRLRALRQRVLDDAIEVHLHGDAAKVLQTDLEKLLDEDYLAMIAEHEERSIRPRLRMLAAQVLDLLGHVFHQAFRSFADHADAIADRILRRVPPEMTLAELPGKLREGFVSSVADFLEAETRAELTGSLATLGRSNPDLLTERALVLPEDGWLDLAASCWDVITHYG